MPWRRELVTGCRYSVGPERTGSCAVNWDVGSVELTTVQTPSGRKHGPLENCSKAPELSADVRIFARLLSESAF